MNIHFTPPEVLFGDQCDNKVDVWSACVVMYVMFTLELPFKDKEQILDKELDFKSEKWNSVSKEAIEFIKLGL